MCELCNNAMRQTDNTGLPTIEEMAEKGCAELRASLGMSEHNTTNTEWPVCPWCGYIDTKLWILPHVQDAKECQLYCRECGKYFTTTYTTHKLGEATATKGDQDDG